MIFSYNFRSEFRKLNGAVSYDGTVSGHMKIAVCLACFNGELFIS